MNNENNNDIIFDTNNTPLDNSTVDYNKLYNVEVEQQTQPVQQSQPVQQQVQIQSQPITQQINQQIHVQQQTAQPEQQVQPTQNLNTLEPNINQPIDDEIINPVVTPLEQDSVNEDSEPEKKKSFVFVIIIALILIIAIMFLFPIIFKKSF